MWTEEEDKKLIEMWEGGAIGSHIAARMMKTRAAIMGRISRLRQKGYQITERPRVPDPEVAERKRAQARARWHARNRKPQPPKAMMKASVQRALELPIIPEQPLSEAPYRDPCDIMGLRFFSCRYIVQDSPTLYCNQIVHKHSYCQKHFELCYQKGTNVPLAAKPRPAYRNA